MNNNTKQFVIKLHRPWRKGLLWLVLVAVPALGWGLFDYGRNRAGYDSAEVARERIAMQAALDESRAAGTVLSQEVANLERHREIDRQAYAEIENTLKVLQLENQELREDIAFLRGIVSPIESAQGMRVQSLSFAASDDTSRGFSYKLVLVQVTQEARLTKGVIRLTVQGLQEGSPAELSLKELGQKSEQIPFGFKYFQRVQGEVQLPEGFEPARAVVKVVADRPKKATLERSFEWRDIAS